MNRYLNDYYNTEVGFDSIREQCEAQGLNADIEITNGKGVKVILPPSNKHNAGDWYVYSDGKYSFMTPEEFASAEKSATVSEGKYTPVGIVASVTDDEGKTVVMALKDASEVRLKWGDSNHQSSDNPTGTTVNYAFGRDFDGKGNTDKIKAAGGEHLSTYYPAASAAVGYKAFDGDETEWYLPSAGEAHRMLSNFGVVFDEIWKYHEYGLGIVLPVEDDDYWCSSEFADVRDFSAWNWYFDASYTYVYTSNKSNEYFLRSFASV